MSKPRCRWPEKQKHASREAALSAIARLERAGRGSPDMSAYQCGDHWHIGHDFRLFQKRIRRALTPGRGPKTLYARNRRRRS